MTPTAVIDLSYQALILVLMLSLPAVITSAVIGILVGLLQAVTQVQDQSISYAAKLIGVSIATVLSARWMAGELYQFGQSMFHLLPMLGHK